MSANKYGNAFRQNFSSSGPIITTSSELEEKVIRLTEGAPQYFKSIVMKMANANWWLNYCSIYPPKYIDDSTRIIREVRSKFL